MKATNLIIGYGYLGKRLLQLSQDEECFVTNRTGNVGVNNSCQSIYSLILDVNNKSSWDNLDGLSEKRNINVYFMVPPRQIDRILFSRFIERLNKLDCRSAILVSSTVVYGNVDRIVDADSEVHIDSERAERQHLIEHDWLAAISNGSIVRLAGLYGPERVIGKQGIANGDAVSGDPDGWLNLIHVDDGARLIKKISKMQQFYSIELGCDGRPIKRREYYSFLAQALNKEPPTFNYEITGRSTGRRCDNRITIERTGWLPEHIDFREILTELIN